MSHSDDQQAELRWVSTQDQSFLPQAFPPREEGSITELTSSIRLHGLLAPLLARETANGLQVICGHKRLGAARAAGLSEVPVVVRKLEDAEAIRCYLSEKAHRTPLPREVQEQALERLRTLRGSRRPTSITEAGLVREVPRRREVVPTQPSAPTRWTPEPDASGPVSTPTRMQTSRLEGAPATGHARDAETPAQVRLRELSKGVERFLAQARERRMIEPQEVESLIGQILELEREGYDFPVNELYAATVDQTAAHSILSAVLAGSVARFLGWKADARLQFVVAGFLHDIGMVFIDGRALRSPEGLRQEERAMLPRHTRIGAALIHAAGAWDEEVAECARDHHERWNGSGYPDGTGGSEASLPARLMSYIDTYAALISPRPHRGPLTPNAARERLEKAVEMGLFDPTLLIAVLGALREARLVTTASPPRRQRENSIELVEASAKMQPKEV